MDTATTPVDPHEWFSFDLDDDTYLIDVTFLTSPWTCIFGQGCLGVFDEPAPELEMGCCSHGAHFTDKDDRRKVQGFAKRLTDAQWQHRALAIELGGPIEKNEDDDWVTRVVDDGCIFLNRPGFEGGSGCALHRAALDAGERPLDWKPDVCWQLPLRLDDHTDDNGHTTYILREWKRRDWGEGGADFHWWCTESPEAFVARTPVWRTLADEIIELIGEPAYEVVAAELGRRGARRRSHPALVVRPEPA